MNAGSLKEKIVSGSLWSFAGSSGNQIFGFIVFIILSHKLSPEDFGVMALAAVFAETMNPLVRLGLSAALIRHREVSEKLTNTVFWLTLATGIFYTVMIYLLAPWIGSAMGMHQLEEVLKLLSPLPVLYALSTVQEAMMERDYRFKALAKRTLIASGTSGGVSITMALTGFGLYSLVFQRLASALLLTGILWFESPWRPKRMFSRLDARLLIAEGLPLMCSSFLVTANGRMKDFLVGVFLGAPALGFLRVAAKLNDFVVQFTINLVTSVALTTFAKLQDDEQAMRAMYQRLTQACSVLAFPAFFGMAAIAPEAVPYIFGEQWQPSVGLMQLFCLASISSTLNYFYKPLMTSLGKAKYVLRVNLLEFTLSAIIITVMAQFSLSMVVVGDVLCYSIITLVTLNHIHKTLRLDLPQFLKGFVPPFVASFIMMLGVFGLVLALRGQIPTALLMMVLVAAGIGLYTGCMLLLFPAYAGTIKESMLPMISGMLKKKFGR